MIFDYITFDSFSEFRKWLINVRIYVVEFLKIIYFFFIKLYRVNLSLILFRTKKLSSANRIFLCYWTHWAILRLISYLRSVVIYIFFYNLIIDLIVFLLIIHLHNYWASIISDIWQVRNYK